MTDYLIIGSGIIGMMTAYELANQGAAVRLVDRNPKAQESSWAGGGILSPLYPWRYDPAVNALASWSQHEYPALCQALQASTGIDPEWTQSGLIMLDQLNLGPITEWATAQHARLEYPDHSRLAKLEPALAATQSPALYMPKIAQVRNPRLLQALRRRLVQLGVEFDTDTTATALLVKNDQVQGVQFGREPVHARHVIIAMGSWSPQLLAPLGIAIDIRPVRGQMLLYRAEPGFLRHIVMSDGKYLIPRRDGRILAGSTVEFAGYEKHITAAAREQLHQVACTLVPALADTPIEQHWAGLRPGAAKGIPYIGPLGIEGLWINAGHFRNGVVTGLASARLLSNLLLNQPTIIDPAPYHPIGRAPSQDQDWI